MYITQRKKEKLHMINKIFSYSRRGIPLGREKGREGWEGGWLVDCRRVGGGERKGKNGMRKDENGVRKTYEG